VVRAAIKRSLWLADVAAQHKLRAISAPPLWAIVVVIQPKKVGHQQAEKLGSKSIVIDCLHCVSTLL
jgi:hypothetical protein